MTIRPFDLGLSEQDERAMRAARLARFEVDREAALRLIADASPIVDAAVRRRPLFSGAPFTLPSDEDAPGAQAADRPGGSAPPKEA
jgi:hypothetical protein